MHFDSIQPPLDMTLSTIYKIIIPTAPPQVNIYPLYVYAGWITVANLKFVQGRVFEIIEKLILALSDYVHWFNTQRVHSRLNYMTPKEYKLNSTS